MKITVEITKVEHIEASGWGRRPVLEVSCLRWKHEHVTFRVVDTAAARKAYAIGRRVDIQIKPVRG